MKTTDLWLATYLILNGEILGDYKKLGHRKVEFVFDISEDKWKDYKLRYLKSDFSRFEQDMSKLRELCYD